MGQAELREEARGQTEGGRGERARDGRAPSALTRNEKYIIELCLSSEGEKAQQRCSGQPKSFLCVDAPNRLASEKSLICLPILHPPHHLLLSWRVRRTSDNVRLTTLPAQSPDDLHNAPSCCCFAPIGVAVSSSVIHWVAFASVSRPSRRLSVVPSSFLTSCSVQLSSHRSLLVLISTHAAAAAHWWPPLTRFLLSALLAALSSSPSFLPHFLQTITLRRIRRLKRKLPPCHSGDASSLVPARSVAPRASSIDQITFHWI